MSDTEPEDDNTESSTEETSPKKREQEEPRPSGDATQGADDQDLADSDQAEDTGKGQRKRPRKSGNPFGITNPIEDMLADINRRNTEMLSGPTKRIFDHINERNRKLLRNPTQKLIEDINRRNAETLNMPLIRLTEQIDARNRALFAPARTFANLARNPGFMDTLLSTARAEVDASKNIADWAVASNSSDPIQRLAKTQLRQAEEVLEQAEELPNAISEDTEEASEESYGKAVSETVHSLVYGSEIRDDTLQLLLKEIQQQGAENTAQWKISTTITIIALVVTALALLGSLPQGIAAIPEAGKTLPSIQWYVGWPFGTGIALLTWLILAVRNSRNESSAKRGRFLSFWHNRTSSLTKGLRWLRILPRKPGSEQQQDLK